MSAQLSEILGIYYVSFQRMLNSSLIQCWIDGSEDYEYIPKETLIEYSLKETEGPSVVDSLQTAFDTTGFYLWDVEAGRVKRLSPTGVSPSHIPDKIFGAYNSGNPNDFKQYGNLELGKDIIRIHL